METSTRRSLWLAVLAPLCVSMAACPPEKRADGDGDKPAKAAGMRFGWLPGDEFDLTYAAERKGTRVEVQTRGTVTAEGEDQLRIHFDPVKLGEKDKKLVEAGKSHAFVDLWPDLLVHRDTGALVSIDGSVEPAAKDIIANRWGTWMTLVGDDLEVGRERNGQAEVEVGEGLIVPAKMHESHQQSPTLGNQVIMTRTLEGEQTKKLWQAMLADSGAPKKEIDGVKEASREEKLTFVTNPKNLRHTRVVEAMTFAVTSKNGKVEKVDMHTETNDWSFTWH